MHFGLSQVLPLQNSGLKQENAELDTKFRELEDSVRKQVLTILSVQDIAFAFLMQ